MAYIGQFREIQEVEETYNPTLSGGFEFYVGGRQVLIKGAVDKLISFGDHLI